MPNRLARSTSPYLLQHADNPVDWWEWGDEAQAAARERDVPILLSVGYAACHWCHVMAHESFEDPPTAAYMNEHFVNVKVDREERPDIDAVYLAATQAMTGQGGWPMTCVLTPDGEPFFAGTYFPSEPRHGMPAFTQVLQALVDAWTNRREEVQEIGAQVVAHVQQSVAAAAPLSADDLDTAAATLSAEHDDEAGGFGTSLKFPPSMVLEFCLRHHARTGSERSLAIVRATGEAMARGGMYDQLGGGFARYSVDRFWRVPHFEKMLYDNALLLRLFLHWWRADGSPLARRVAEETAAFLLVELRTAEGGFASSLDADTEGEEGTFYVWDRAQLDAALGPDDGAWVADLLGVTPTGTFERGLSTLQFRTDPDDAGRWTSVRERLLSARDRRVRPGRDDKVVAAWNGLAVTALAEAAVLLEDPALADAAIAAADLLVRTHGAGVPGTRFVRTSRDGVAGSHAAVLDDHGCVAEAFLAVLGLTGDPVWLTRAGGLLDDVLTGFAAPGGGFHDTAAEAEALIARPHDPSDNATPSGTSALTHGLLAMAAVTGEQRWRDAAEESLAAAADVARAAPRFAGWTLAAAEAALAGPREIAVVGPVGERAAMHRAALSSTSPGAVVVAGAPDTDDIPLLAGRAMVGDRATAYVCRRLVCDRPTTEVRDLATPSEGRG